MSERQTLVVNIRGQEFRIRSDEDPAVLKQVASYVGDTMAEVEKTTGTVDTLDVSMLTSLNLAREALGAQESISSQAATNDRMRALIELAESALADTD